MEQEIFKTLLESLQQETTVANPLEHLQRKAWQRFLSLGLPSHQNELYRSIKLRPLFSQHYQRAEETTVPLDQLNSWIYPECRQSVLIFVNGRYAPLLSDLRALPRQVKVSSLKEAMSTYGALLNNYWAKTLKEETDPFAMLNGALHAEGAFLYLPPKCILESPIQILHLIHQNGQPPLLFPRLHVFASPHSHVHFIATQRHLAASSYFVNQVSEFLIDEGAHVHYAQLLCDEPPLAWHVDALRAILKRDSTLHTLCVTEGSATVRTDYKICLTGENGEALLNGVSMLAEAREAHTHVFIDHQAPACRSQQLFKAVLNDFSRSSFQGKIMVRKLAQQTEAFQLNKNLLLNDHVYADSKPNLEIFADDVKASHGATIGQLDPDQLFYMKTRGFSDKEAKSLLVHGFCEEIIRKIPLPSLREQMFAKTAQSMGETKKRR